MSDLGFDRVPVEPNISPDYFARERETIFKKVWLKVGRVEEVAEPGDFMVRDFSVLSASIIIVRGSDGGLRAFHNVCRHRGNRLKPACEGRAKTFTCGFHGWAFNIDGDLAHVPLEDNFGALDKSELGLLPVAIDTWQGEVLKLTGTNHTTMMDDNLKGRTIIKLCPNELQKHLKLRGDQFRTYVDIKIECIRYAAEFKGKRSTPSPMQADHLHGHHD